MTGTFTYSLPLFSHLIVTPANFSPLIPFALIYPNSHQETVKLENEISRNLIIIFWGGCFNFFPIKLSLSG